MKRQLQLCAVISVVALAGAVSAFGQQKATAERDVVITRDRSPQPGDAPQDPAGQGDKMFTFVALEGNFDGKLVKGAPYSAQGVTETIQTLGDGNRIINKSTSAIYRDSEGRTRREHTLQAIGPVATAGEPPPTTPTHDPAAGVH